MTKKEREHRISVVTIWGAASNLALSAFKVFAGIVGKSSAMVADGIHSLSDLVSDVVVLVMVSFSSKEKDKGHDYGHGKYETIATVVISLLLMVVSIKLVGSAVEKILLVSHGGTLEVPKTIALWAAIISIVVKELLYRWTAKVGREIDSPAMIANAWHHRSDALSSVGAALGIGGAVIFGNKMAILDPVAGCIIGVLIFIVAIRMLIPAIKELVESSLSEDTEKQIIEVLEGIGGIENAHALQTRSSGPNIIIDVHVVVDPDMTVLKAHDLTTQAEQALKEKFGDGTQVSIHIEPSEDSE